MIKLAKFSKSFIAVVSAMAFISTASIASAKNELSFQSNYAPAQTQQIEIFGPWAESFKKNSKGELIVNNFPVNSIVEFTENGPAVRKGIVDMASWSSVSFPKDHPHPYIFSIPGIATSSVHGTNLIYDLYEKVPAFKKEVDMNGEILFMFSSATMAIASTKEPIRSPADLKGKRVIVVDAGANTLAEAWGAIPVFTSTGDAYIGLQRGMGEALISAVPFQKGLRIMEVAKYVTPVTSTFNANFVSINKDLFDDLPKDQQELLKKSSGKELGLKMSRSLDADVKGVLDSYQVVVELTPAEMKVFDDAARALIDSYWVPRLKEVGIKGDVKKTINQFYDISAKASKK